MTFLKQSPWHTGQMVLCALAVVAQLYLPIPILKQLADEFGISPANAGYALTAFSLPYALGFLVFGPLSDRVGRRTVMACGLLALTACTLLLQLASTPETFLGLRALQGFAAATYPPVAIAYLAERGTPRQRAWGMAWISTAFLMAGLLGQIYGAFVGKFMHFGVALLPLCVIYLGTAAMLWHAPQTQAAPTPQAAGWSSVSQALRQVIGDVQLRRAYIPALVLLMCFVTFYIGLDARMGLPLQQSGFSQLNIREIALPGFLAPLAVAMLLPRLAPQRIVSAGLGIATAGLLCAAAVTAPMAVLAASVLFVTGIGITVPGLIARVASTAASHYRGMAIAFYTFTLFVGASLGPWVASQTASLDSRHFFGLLAIIMAVAAAISWSRPARHRIDLASAHRAINLSQKVFHE